jgi:hypothetical protein
LTFSITTGVDGLATDRNRVTLRLYIYSMGMYADFVDFIDLGIGGRPPCLYSRQASPFCTFFTIARYYNNTPAQE